MDAVFGHRICGSAQFEAFIVLAVAIGALASPVIIWSADAGPILNQGVPFDGLSPLETCSGDIHLWSER